MKVKSLSPVQLCDPTDMGFSRQEYWSWLPFPFPEDLPDTGIEPRSPALQADTLTSIGTSYEQKLQSSVGASLLLYLSSPVTLVLGEGWTVAKS